MPAPTLSLLAHFDRRYRDLTGFKYPVSRPKDPALLAQVYRDYPDHAVELIDLFFETDDPFHEKAGWSVGVFRSQLPKLLMLLSQQQRQAHIRSRLEDWRADCVARHGGRCGAPLAPDAMGAVDEA